MGHKCLVNISLQEIDCKMYLQPSYRTDVFLKTTWWPLEIVQLQYALDSYMESWLQWPAPILASAQPTCPLHHRYPWPHPHHIPMQHFATLALSRSSLGSAQLHTFNMNSLTPLPILLSYPHGVPSLLQHVITPKPLVHNSTAQVLHHGPLLQCASLLLSQLVAIPLASHPLVSSRRVPCTSSHHDLPLPCTTVALFVLFYLFVILSLFV